MTKAEKQTVPEKKKNPFISPEDRSMWRVHMSDGTVVYVKAGKFKKGQLGKGQEK